VGRNPASREAGQKLLTEMKNDRDLAFLNEVSSVPL
jgi:hypothetical protein